MALAKRRVTGSIQIGPKHNDTLISAAPRVAANQILSTKVRACARRLLCITDITAMHAGKVTGNTDT
jgi:hypothetical protein